MTTTTTANRIGLSPEISSQWSLFDRASTEGGRNFSNYVGGGMTDIIRCCSTGSIATSTTVSTSTFSASPTLLRSSSSTCSGISTTSSTSRRIRNKCDDDANAIEPPLGTYKGTFRKPISRRSFTEVQEQQHEELQEAQRRSLELKQQKIKQNEDEKDDSDHILWGTRRHRSSRISDTTRASTFSLIEENNESFSDDQLLELLLSSEEYQRNNSPDYLLSTKVLLDSEEVAWQMQCQMFLEMQDGDDKDVKKCNDEINVKNQLDQCTDYKAYKNNDDDDVDDEYNQEVEKYLFELDQAILLSKECEEERRRSELDSQLALEIQCELMLGVDERPGAYRCIDNDCITNTCDRLTRGKELASDTRDSILEMQQHHIDMEEGECIRDIERYEVANDNEFGKQTEGRTLFSGQRDERGESRKPDDIQFEIVAPHNGIFSDVPKNNNMGVMKDETDIDSADRTSVSVDSEMTGETVNRHSSKKFWNRYRASNDNESRLRRKSHSVRLLENIKDDEEDENGFKRHSISFSRHSRYSLFGNRKHLTRSKSFFQKK